jgi:hypothetical protein
VTKKTNITKKRKRNDDESKIPERTNRRQKRQGQVLQVKEKTFDGIVKKTTF